MFSCLYNLGPPFGDVDDLAPSFGGLLKLCIAGITTTLKSRWCQRLQRNHWYSVTVISLVVLLQLEKVAINDALPLKAARHDAMSSKNLVGASNLSCRETQCRFIEIRRWAPRYWHLQRVQIDWGRNRILSVGKNSCNILSRLWNNVYDILG